jgi:hypothetical protein
MISSHFCLQGTICHEAGLAVGTLSGHDAFFKFSDELFAVAKVSFTVSPPTSTCFRLWSLPLSTDLGAPCCSPLGPLFRCEHFRHDAQ